MIRFTRGLVLPLLLSSAIARADDETIVVTAQALRAEHAPGGVSVTPAAEFRDTLAVSLRDALAFSPGVYAQPRFGQEVRLSIRGSGISRGFHMRGLLLMQDGVPINLADNNGDFQEFDPQVFEHLEVYRGGNALRFGGSTLGGAINAVTPTGRTAPGVELRADGGSYGTLRTKAALGFADARGDAWMALTTDRSDGDRQHADRDAVRFTGNIGLVLGEGAETRFYASVNSIDQRLPGALTLAQALSTPRLSLPANISGDQQRNVDSIRLQNRTTVDFGRVTVSAGGFVNAKQLFHPIFQVVDQKSTDYGAFTQIEGAGEVAGLPFELSAGTTARFGHVAARQYVNAGGKRGAQTADARQSARTIDSYAEFRLTPVERLSLLAGAVHTHGLREVDNRLSAARSGSASFDTLSPKLGLLYEPIAGVQVFAGANRSVELPGYSELNQTPFAVGGVVAPGFVDVGAQKAWTIEAGTRGTFGIARWDFTAYRARLRGEMLQFNQAPDIPAATFNAGRTLHQGIEASLDLQLSPWLLLRQSYQLNDFGFRDDVQFGDNRLPVIASQLWRGSLRIGSERLSVTPNVERLPRGAWADYANTVRAPGYTLVGLGAEAPLGHVRLLLDARNLTNRKAVGDISAVTLATPASAIFYPVERRALYGGVRATF